MGRASALKLKTTPTLKLDLGCGQSKRDGFTGVDKFKAPGVDVVYDLLKMPWPWADNSVAEAHCSHFFEHLPALQRPAFMDELYRVLVVGGSATIVVPYYNSMRAIQDYSHQWPPVAESSFLYFNKGWREANRLTHGVYDLKSDFDFTYGYVFNPQWASRAEETRTFAVAHYTNAVMDLQVNLTKRAPAK